MEPIGNDWDDLLKDEFKKPYFTRLQQHVEMCYASFPTCPPRECLSLPFKLTPYEKAKVVILGREPYHEAGVANGLAFSAADGAAIPPTLQNIFTELQNDIGCPIPGSGNLESWAKQGVLLFNCIFTVREGLTNSHRNYGWEKLTMRILRELDQKPGPVVFILWGNFARYHAGFLKNPEHLVITGFHPSPLSAERGFFGTKPFSRANEYLVEHGETPIDWSL